MKTKLIERNHWVAIAMVAAFCSSASSFAKGGNGVVSGSQTQQQQQQNNHVQQQLSNPANFKIDMADKTSAQEQNIQNNLASQVKSMLTESESGKNEQLASFLNAWKANSSETASLSKIVTLVQSGTLSGHSLEIARGFLKLQSAKVVRPSTVLDAMETWAADSQRGFAMKLYEAVREKNKAARAGKSMTGDQAFENVLEDAHAYCASCGC